jgi:hypothetical protein
MSFLEQRSSGQFHLVFCFGGQRFKKALKTTQTDVAEAARVRLDENLRLVTAGRLVIPDGRDVPTFLLFDTLTVVGHRAWATAMNRQPTLRSVQRLDRGLLVGAEHQSVLRRIEVQLHHVHQLFRRRFY